MYKIYGVESAVSITKEDLEFFDLNIEIDEEKSTRIETQSARGSSDLIELGDLKEYDLVSIEYDDGGSWIFTIEEYEQYLTKRKDRGGDGFIIQPYLQGNSRSFAKIKEEIIEFFKIKIIGKSVNVLASKIEEKMLVPEEGLYDVNENVEIVKLTDSKAVAAPYLLLLHGTISNTKGSFGKFKDSDQWKDIYNHYNGRIIALEHKTLSKGVIDNARDLINHLPKGIELDILSGSRGGLIGEILTAMSETVNNDSLDNGFPSIVDRLELNDLKDLCQSKGIKIRKSVRTSCPASGTSLLGNSVPDFLQIFNNATKLLDQGGVPGKLFKGLKLLITFIIKQKDNKDALPGLNDMIPTTEFIHNLNTSEFFDTPLLIISGSIQPQDLAESIKIKLTNWIFKRPNDLIVDTISMSGGLRRNNVAEFNCKESLDHFKYFKLAETRNAIKTALQSDGSVLNLKDFEVLTSGGSSRGVIDMGVTPANPDDSSLGAKPILVLVPGILGSTLSHKDKRLWVKLFKLLNSGIEKIELKPDDQITASGGIGDFYNKFVEHFRKFYDVIVFPYDWRKSVDKAGKLFIDRIKELSEKEVTVHVVAHSMGGLVVRELMMHEAGLQKKLEEKGGRLIMLGTPWKGSFLIPETLNGSGKRFGQLRKLAICSHSKKDLLKVVSNFDGIYSLLPMYKHDFEESETWKEMNLLVNIPKSNLTWFKKYKDDFLAAEDKLHYKNLYYIAGYAENTVDEYKVENGKTIFSASPERPGDGSVTWDSGIPDLLDRRHLYFTNTGHGELCNEPELYEGIHQLIEKGEVDDSMFFNTRDGIDISQSRGGLPSIYPSALSNKPDDIIRDILGLNSSNEIGYSKDNSKVTIQIVNGDLKYAEYPVMIGHFHKDAIISAEYVMNILCENLLAERNRLGAYPGLLGTSYVLPPQNTTNPGTVILGLGFKQEINPARLQHSVEQGVIEYLLHPQIKDKEGISTLMVGSGYGNIVLSECLNAIIKGVLNANRRFKEVFPDRKTIKNIEVIELYKDRAERAYEFIADNEKTYSSSNVHLAKTLVSDFGRRELSDYSREKKWWKSVTVTSPSDGEDYGKKIEFTLSSDLARVDQSVLKVDVSLVDRLIGKIEPNTPWDGDQIQAAFKLLIPNELRLMLNGNNSIIWILDRFTAKYPWELLHFSDLQKKPTAVEAGMIRQLTFKKMNSVASYVNTKDVCVIADPRLGELPEGYESLGQLDGAKREGEMVNSKFAKNGFISSSLINKTEIEIFPKILLNRFKVLHFACHGVVEYGPDKDKKTGIVVNFDSIITPEILGNLDYMPDFIFVNCCYGGFIGEGPQNSFSPNVGTTLIEKGVKAIIVGAWKIDDSAAYYFAEKFYDSFLIGEYFGESVRKAREACYQRFSFSNTWGAYQCYGNQYYRLTDNSNSGEIEKSYNLEKDILIELEEIKNNSNTLKARKDRGKSFKKLLLNVSKGIDRSNLRTASISEKEAYIYTEIGDYASAIEIYEKMLASNDQLFTIWAKNFYSVIKSKYLIEQYTDGKIKKSPKDQLKKMVDEAKEIYSTSPSLSNGVMYCSVIKNYLMSWTFKEDPEDESAIEKFQKFKNDYKSELENLSNIYFEICKKENSEEVDSHTFCMFIILASMTSKNVGSIKKSISKTIERDVDVYLNELMMQVDKNKKRNFWDEIKKLNILEAQLSLLVGDEKEKIITITNEIKSCYSEAWSFGGSRRNLLSEIDQINFTLKSVDIMSSYAKNLEEALAGLKTFYKVLEKESFGGDEEI